MKMNRRIVLFAKFVWVFHVLRVPVLVFAQQADKKSASLFIDQPMPHGHE
ncbi:MAG: hypothetical protein ABR915_01945 [Thermoguttaceae bacterium]|jgi:hypothetical protein